METPGKQWARRKARREPQGERVDWPPLPYSNGRIIALLVGLGLAVVAVLLLLWIGLVEPT